MCGRGLTGGLNNESIPYEGRLLRGVQLRRISAAQDRQAVELAEEPAELPPSPRAAAGDPRRLRGFPVVGAWGVDSAMPGTQPEQALPRKFGDD